MPKTIQRPSSQELAANWVTPSIVDSRHAKPFTLDQELRPFGEWVEKPIWVPPKDCSTAMAESMLQETRPFESNEKRWAAVLKQHRSQFTQVREIDLYKASIRLPKGRFFVTVTEQKNFDQITDTIPDCVQTRLDEFLSGPGKKAGTKVYYLKPLCVEVENQLLLTTQEDLEAAIRSIQDEVYAEYFRMAPGFRTKEAIIKAINLGLAVPRRVVNYFVQRRQKAIDTCQARLEFKRRKTALGAARTYQKCRTDGCSFDEMLELTNPLKREDVIEQYCDEQEVSKIKREQLLKIAAGSVPWFVALSVSVSTAMSIASTISMLMAPPVIVCDPAFVAEMPNRKGVLLKIGHFDEVDGVTYVEI